MINTLKRIFGLGNPTDFARLVKDGAMIIDVRSPGEFAGGNIKGAINLPVDQLPNQLSKLSDKNRAIITCCASGMRSGIARKILKSNGYSNVFNGGGWHSLQTKLKS